MLERSNCASDFELGEDREDGRHAGEARDALLRDAVQDLGGVGERALEDEARAHPERHDHLIEAVVERERQKTEDHVVLDVLEVRRDRRRRGEHVAVREHHALRVAGAARGVDDRGEVDVDAPPRGRLGALLGDRLDDDRSEVLVAFGGGAEHLREARIGDERGRAAVLQEIGELVSLRLRVHDDRDRVRLQRRPERDDRLGAVVVEDDDAIAARDAALDEHVRERVGALIDVGVREALAAAHERDFVRQATRRILQVIVKERNRGFHAPRMNRRWRS